MTKKILILSFLIATVALQAQQYSYDDEFAVDYDEDTQSSDQWYLDLIQVQEAWEITLGVPDIPIAYICASGVYWLHEDLGDNGDGFDNIHRTGIGDQEEWTDWDDPVDNLFDDDGNGYDDDWRGLLNLGYLEGTTNNTLLQDPSVFHSTWITGIMSAKNIGASGIHGMAGGGQSTMGNSLMISAYDFTNHTFNDTPQAMNYAIENGAKVIIIDALISQTQFAWGSLPGYLDAAFNAGCFVIAPTGWNGNSTIYFPSSYINNGYSVFSVGASTKPDAGGDEFRHGSSNYGWGSYHPNGLSNSSIDLVAPGEQIYTTSHANDDEYLNVKGAAPAAAMVAATVGLMLSVNPDLTYAEIETILHETAEKIGEDDYYFYVDDWHQEVGYGRLNTYRAVCAALATAPPPVVINGATWDEPKFSLNDIVVPADFTLTITSTVYFGEEARFIIEPGATVTIDGGTLTNYKFCENEYLLWKGVEVHGDASIHQYVCGGIQHQGKIIITNGGTIENAEIGVLLGARDVNSEGDFLDEKAGGIIQVPYGGDHQVYDANFINNKWAVRFWKYQNYTYDPYNCLNDRPTGNLSYFKNCHFDINADYLGGAWWHSNVHLYAVDGISFYGCVFDNNKTTDPSGLGINAYASGFKVEHICTSAISPCPRSSQVRSSFTNFGKAVNSISSGIYTATIKNTDFVDNSRGVRLSNVNNATVLFSDFYLGKPTDCGLEEDAAIGIDMYDCIGFAIEENYFTKGAGKPTGYYIGTRVLACKSVWDIIYKNDFVGLSYGNYAQGKNRATGSDQYGVEYQCNTNTDNAVDFIVIDVEPENAMIRTEQGSEDNASGNTFSETAAWHYRNEGLQYINYYYCETCPNEEPDMNRVYTTNGLPLFDPDPSNENTCPSHYGGGGGVGTDGRTLLTGDEELAREQDFAQNYSDYQNVKVLYDNLKDGGNTEATVTDVETSWPQDMWALRAELLGKSPHLSMDVLKAAADKTDVLPESVLFEILSANPDELKKTELISYLEDKEQPLPQYMIDILKQLSYGVTYKTILKRQMAKYHANKSQAALDMVRSILAGPVMDMQQYRNWMDNLGGLSADKQIIASYISEGNFIDAQAMLDLLPSLYNFEGENLAAYNNYKTITEMQINWQQQGSNIFGLDTNEVALLQDYAENSQGSARSIARNILNFAYDTDYCDCIVDPDNSFMKSSGAFPSGSFNKMYGPEISVKPNPAGDWTTFYYELPGSFSDGFIEITDVSGSMVKTFSVSGKQGQQLWDTRKIKPGVYLYTFKVNGISKSGKIIISK